MPNPTIDNIQVGDKYYNITVSDNTDITINSVSCNYMEVGGEVATELKYATPPNQHTHDPFESLKIKDNYYVTYERGGPDMEYIQPHLNFCTDSACHNENNLHRIFLQRRDVTIQRARRVKFYGSDSIHIQICWDNGDVEDGYFGDDYSYDTYYYGIRWFKILEDDFVMYPPSQIETTHTQDSSDFVMTNRACPLVYNADGRYGAFFWVYDMPSGVMPQNVKWYVLEDTELWIELS